MKQYLILLLALQNLKESNNIDSGKCGIFPFRVLEPWPPVPSYANTDFGLHVANIRKNVAVADNTRPLSVALNDYIMEHGCERPESNGNLENTDSYQ